MRQRDCGVNLTKASLYRNVTINPPVQLIYANNCFKKRRLFKQKRSKYKKKIWNTGNEERATEK
jgi:hypothetical protein